MQRRPYLPRSLKSSRGFRPQHASALARERLRLIGESWSAEVARIPADSPRVKPTLPRVAWLDRPLDGGDAL